MDELETYELNLLMKNIRYSYKNEYEIGRLIAYSTIQPHLDQRFRKKSMRDLYPLRSDEDLNVIHNYSITDEDKERIKAVISKTKDMNKQIIKFQ